MAPGVWFTLILRALGVWELVYSVEAFVTLQNVTHNVFQPYRTEAGAYISHGIASLLMGLILLIGAPAIASIFYPRQPATAMADSSSLG